MCNILTAIQYITIMEPFNIWPAVDNFPTEKFISKRVRLDYFFLFSVKRDFNDVAALSTRSIKNDTFFVRWHILDL